ncbi:MAG: hypothetical protein RIC15_06495 [Vicingaceae bacterium]
MNARTSVINSTLFFCGLLAVGQLAGQNDKDRNWSLNGYVKNMTSHTLISDSSLTDNLVHNRLNFKWYPSDHVKVVAEMRNRLFIGDQVRFNPFFTQLLKGANDYFDWTYSVENNGNFVLHFMLDRAYLQYSLEKLEIKLGRQRVNWGINTVWNPNDLFNAFSYFDFDYEERPGSDAISIRYYTGVASSIEVAGKMADDLTNFTGAGLWRFNLNNYDYQILGGLSNNNLVVGGGWAGNILKAGFKGEGSYFLPLSNALDKSEVLVASVSMDYSFKNSLYINVSGLYSSNGSVSPNFIEQALYYSGNISAKYLSPYRWSVFLQSGYQFHPLVNGGLALITYPASGDAFIGPYVGVSVLQNLDLDAFAQVLFSQINGTYQTTTQAYYLRLKYSF